MTENELVMQDKLLELATNNGRLLAKIELLEGRLAELGDVKLDNDKLVKIEEQLASHSHPHQPHPTSTNLRQDRVTSGNCHLPSFSALPLSIRLGPAIPS